MNLTRCYRSQGSLDEGDVLNYTWNFGDGTGAAKPIVRHTYTKSGTYTATLTVDDNSGTSCSTATDSFEATVNESPIPVIEVR